MTQEAVTLRQEYECLTSLRDPFLKRGQDCAKFTIPTLLPPDGSTSSARLKRSYSSFGARCVNSLSAKMTMALFPANIPFFKLQLTEAVLRSLQAEDKRADLEQALASIEQQAMDEVEAAAARDPANTAVKHLIVAGNVLVYLAPNGGIRAFPLTKYVTKRDASGNVLKTILKEQVSPMALDPVTRAAALARDKLTNPQGSSKDSAERTLDLYTGIYRRNDNWEIYQEVVDVPVPHSRHTQPLDSCPWLPLRWTRVDGEDYGRSMVEDYLGDLVSLEGLTAAMVKGSAAMARVVFLARAGGAFKKAAFTRAETGDVIDGDAESVTVVQAEKRADFQVVQGVINDIKSDLSYAFMLSQAIQRNAERVTAEEIRYMASDLDSLQGGTYSILSQDLQLPYVQRLINSMQRQGKVPALPKGTVKPIIVTGLAALGRGAELENLKALSADIVELGGPEALRSELDFGDLVKRLATARGVKPRGLILTAEQKAAQQQQQQMQQIIEQLGPNAVSALGGLGKQAMANGQPLQLPTPQ